MLTVNLQVKSHENLELIALRATTLAANETPLMVQMTLLRNLLGLEHASSTFGTGVGLLLGLDLGCVSEDGRRSRSVCVSMAGFAVQLALVEGGCHSAQKLFAVAAFVAALVVLSTS